MRAVDLAAVRSARSALDALAAAHPELTQPPARDRLACALPEIIAMKPLDPNATGAARTITVRLSADLIAHLEAERDRLAALVPGSSLGLSDAVRSMILRAVATPPARAPAAPAAPAAARPVVVVAPSPDTRQLELAPVVALHTSPSGASVATRTGNDNAQPDRTRPVEAPALVDAATVGARLRALAATDTSNPRQWSYRAIGERAGVSRMPVGKLFNGEPVMPEIVAKIAKILPPE